MKFQSTKTLHIYIDKEKKKGKNPEYLELRFEKLVTNKK